MATTLMGAYGRLGATAVLVDLREFVLPLCYNYGGNAAAKNLLELTGSSWENKTVGFLCAAGGAASYMSIMGLANSLMLDFRCLIIPRFVYAQGGDLKTNQEPTAELASRIEQLAETSLKIRNSI
jgi:NAD(P)H-dependent FMN reductase